MATTAQNSDNPTLSDIVKATDPDGKQAKIVEALRKRTPLLDYMTWKVGNLDTGERVTTETQLPSIGYRAFNEGVAAGKFKSAQFDEVCGLMEGRSIVDSELMRLHGNDAGYRASRDMRFLRAFKYELSTGIFYNSTAASPRKFNGLAPRFANLSGTPYYRQVVDSSTFGGSGNDQTSIWLICFSPETVYGIVPKHGTVGLRSKDRGEQTITDEAGNRFDAFETVWNWDVGLAVADAEAVVRIANVDMGSIALTGTAIIDDMRTAYFRLRPELRDGTAGRVVWVMNGAVEEYLYSQVLGSTGASTLARTDYENGGPLMKYMGFPILRDDAILLTESPVA